MDCRATNSIGLLPLTREGEMFFGGVHGISAFDPAQIQDNLTPPPVVISSFRFQRTLHGRSIRRDARNLSYRQNFIAFEFVALDFHAPQQNQYAYMLEGFDKDWIDGRQRRYASYTNLPGGDYVFRVRPPTTRGMETRRCRAHPYHPAYLADLVVSGRRRADAAGAGAGCACGWRGCRHRTAAWRRW